MNAFLKLLAGLAFCAVALFAAIYFGAEADTKQKIEDAKALSAQVAKAIAEKQIVVGMTPQEVITSWGDPKRKNVSGGAGGAREQWIYDGTYLYFQGGRVVSWQQSQPGR